MPKDIGDQRYLNPGMAVVEISIGDDVPLGEGAPQRHLISSQVFRDLTVDVYADTYAETMRLSLFDPSYDEIEDLLITTKRQTSLPVVNLSWGWQNGPMTGFRRFEVTNITNEYAVDGTYLTIEGTIPGSINAMLNREARVYPAGWSASHIANEIIRDKCGLTPFVEPSAPLEQAVTLAENTSPHHFLRAELPKLAKTENGITDQFVFFIDGDTGYFVTKTFMSRRNNEGFFREYMFARDPIGTMISFETEQNSAFVAASGTESMKAGSYDPLKKLYGTLELSRDDIHPRLIAGGRKVLRVDNLPGQGVGRFIPTPLQNKDELDSFLKWKLNEVARRTVQAKATVIGDPKIHTSQYLPVRIIFARRDGRPHPSSGTWWIWQARHNIGSSGTYTTDLSLQRYGTGRGDKPLETLDLSTDIPEFSANREAFADPNFYYQKRTVVAEKLS